MNAKNCKRCGAELQIGPNATNKKFCSTKCYRMWWDDERFLGSTQASRVEKQLGSAPNFRLTEIQAAWLAGVIDGEGSIGIWKTTGNDRPHKRYRPAISVANTHERFIAQIAGLLDSSVHIKGNGNLVLGHKKCWAVWVKTRAIPNLLEQIAPYLVIKRKQADLVLEFCRAVAASPVHNRAMQPEFERLYLECKALNKRGTL